MRLPDRVDDLAVAVEALDVNRLADAANAARLISESKPGLIFVEVELADAEIREAIRALIRARGHLATAIGRMVIDARSS
jgi:hypothetical protein